MRQGAPRALFRDVGRGPRRKETDDGTAARARTSADRDLRRGAGRRARDATGVFGWHGHRLPAPRTGSSPASRSGRRPTQTSSASGGRPHEREVRTFSIAVSSDAEGGYMGFAWTTGNRFPARSHPVKVEAASAAPVLPARHPADASGRTSAIRNQRARASRTVGPRSTGRLPTHIERGARPRGLP